MTSASSPTPGRAGSTGRQGAFLASLLQRYPELVSLRYLAPQGLLEFTFVAEGRMGRPELRRLREELEGALQALGGLVGMAPGFLEVRGLPVDEYTQLTVQRDLDTLHIQEIGLIIGVVHHQLGPRLLAEYTGEPGVHAPASLAATEAESSSYYGLSRLLDDLKDGGRSTLIGLRLSGRVMVLNQSGQACWQSRSHRNR